MELIKLLTKALWITGALFALFWCIKYLYEKFKPKTPLFFYLISIDKKTGEWQVRIESPIENLEMLIAINSNTKTLVTKNVCLKVGKNKITIKSSALTIDTAAIIKITTSNQTLERAV